jgi:hypothetical protein
MIYLFIYIFLISYQPTGRPIQVEGGNGERLPSIDTRPPRIRDSDAIIEVLNKTSLKCTDLNV